MKKHNEIYGILRSIINGNLQPHKNDKKDLSTVNDILSLKLKKTKDNNFKIIEDYRYDYLFKKEKIIELNIDENKNKHTFTIKKDEELKELININIPPPDDEKSALYLTLIELEYDLIKKEINTYIKKENNLGKLKVFALKNIHELKELAKQLYTYNKKIKTTKNYPYEATEYTVVVLKYYIICLIIYVQEVFSTFFEIKRETQSRLRFELYNEDLTEIFQMPVSSIFPLLPKNDKYQRLKEFLKKQNPSSKKAFKSKKSSSLGENIFEFYKFEFENNIDNYVKEKLFWEKLLIKNKLKVINIDRYINHPEIEKILIPLFEKEIEYLKNSENKNNVAIKNEFDFAKLTQNIIDVLVKMSKRNYGNNSENINNDYLSDLLQERHYHTDNQARTGNKLIDIEIQKENGATISIIEGLKLSYLNKNCIYDHIYKLLHEYDKTGNYVNYIIVYSECADYQRFQKKYFNFLHQINDYKLGLKYSIKNIIDKRKNTGKADIYLAETIHDRNSKEVSIYHLIVNMKK